MKINVPRLTAADRDILKVLSFRQRYCLRMLLRGHSLKYIAGKLYMSGSWLRSSVINDLIRRYKLPYNYKIWAQYPDQVIEQIGLIRSWVNEKRAAERVLEEQFYKSIPLARFRT